MPDSLPHPVVFVWPPVREVPILQSHESLPVPDDYPYGIPPGEGTGAYNWIVQTFLWFRDRGHDVQLCEDYVPGAICVAHSDHIRVRRYPLDSFVVLANPDRARAHLANLRVVQNHRQVSGPQDHYITHWPQPGLIPRDPARGDRVERIAFVGRYATDRYAGERIESGIRALGMQFRVTGMKEWHEMREVDVAVSARTMPSSYLQMKPPSKLINSWHADCPAILGPEPAFQDLRRSELDYLEVDSPDELLEALRQLRNDPALYRAMIENGRGRREEFTVDMIVREWENYLSGPVARAYERWRDRRGVLEPMRRRCWYAVNTVKHLLARRDWKRRYPPPPRTNPPSPTMEHAAV